MEVLNQPRYIADVGGPVAHVEVISPVHGRPEEDDICMSDVRTEKGFALHSPSWKSLHLHTCATFDVDPAAFLLRFRYRRGRGEWLELHSWLALPLNLRLGKDIGDEGRCVRLYAYFFPYRRVVPQLPDPPVQIEETWAPWWSSDGWSRVPLWSEIYADSTPEWSPTEPGTEHHIEWLRRGLRHRKPVWWDAHDMPPLWNIQPSRSPKFQPRRSSTSARLRPRQWQPGHLPAPPPTWSPFLDTITPEIREMIYSLLLDFGGFQRAVGDQRRTWRTDVYIRQTPAILLVSKAVGREAREVLYSQPLALTGGIARGTVVGDITHVMSPGLLVNLRTINLSYDRRERVKPLPDDFRDFIRMAWAVVNLWQAFVPESGTTERALAILVRHARLKGHDRDRLLALKRRCERLSQPGHVVASFTYDLTG